MAKLCSFCSYQSEDAVAFADHMRVVHGWGAQAPMRATTAPPQVDGVPKFCGNCGAPRDAASTNFCRSCGVPFAASEPAAAPEASPAFAPKAGFWIRLVAYAIDSVIVGVIGFLVGVVFGALALAADISEDDVTLVAQVVGQILGVTYFVYFWSGRGQGQTPGMKAMKIRLIRTDGTYASVGRAFLRNIGFGISALALGIGLIWVAFDKQKQGWHDKIADTYVIRLRA